MFYFILRTIDDSAQWTFDMISKLSYFQRNGDRNMSNVKFLSGNGSRRHTHNSSR